MSKPAILAEPILVGRERELEELYSLLNSAALGNGRTVFISGEAGSGKTRLTREFLDSAKRKGMIIMAGWCLSDAAVPFFPFIEAFNAYFESSDEGEEPVGLQESGDEIDGSAQIGVGTPEIATWLSGPKPLEKLGRTELLLPQVWKDQAFDRVAKTLLTISLQGPLVLFLEDVHWADSASLALLHYISRVVKDSERILVLASFRSEEVTTDAEGHPHQLEKEMQLMRREDLFAEIKLSNLNQANVSAIAQNMMGGPVQQYLVEKLARESNGNALFLVESLRMLVERKGLVQKNNEWRLAFDNLGIPSKIKDIILRRLSVLKYVQRRVLDAASVIGEEFSVDLLASVLGQDSLDVLETLNFIAQSTSMVRVEEAFYRFDHARSREVLYEALSLPLKRGYHARIARQLESMKGEKPPVADLAYHYAQADDKKKAVTYSLAAGQEALARWSNIEAAKHFTYVLQAVGDNSEPSSEKTVALEGLGDAYYANNSFTNAAKTFERLADIQEGAVKLRALRKAMFAAYYEGNFHRLEELTDKAEKNATADRLESARVLHQKARVLGVQGRFLDSLRLNEEALKVFEEEYALSDAAWSLFVVGQLESVAGQREIGIAAALRSIALYDELRDFRSQMEAHYYLGVCFSIYRLEQEARDNFMKVIEIDDRLKMADYIQLIPAYAYWAVDLHLTGDFEGGIPKSLKALEYSERTCSNLYLGLVYENLVVEHTYIGDMAQAEYYFEKLINLPQDVLLSGFNKTLLGSTKAIYCAGKNRFEESNRYFQDFFESAKAAPIFPSMMIGNKRGYAWCLSKQGRLEEANAQLEQAEQLAISEHEKFGHVSIVASLMSRTRPVVGQIFSLRLDLVNVSRSLGSIIKVENLLVPELKIVDFPADCNLKEGSVEFKDNTIKPFQVKTIMLTVKAMKTQVFNLNPSVKYMDELAQTRTVNPRLFTIAVQPVAVEDKAVGKITTGFSQLDDLLLGGIPKGYALALTSPAFEERLWLVERFVEAGAKNGETTFYLTNDIGKGKEILAKEFTSNLRLFVCSPRAGLVVEDLPNVFTLKGVDNLTDIDIALTRAYRHLDASQVGPRRACIEITSDVLLQHHAVTTRKWLSGLIQDLKSKGFTVLAVVDPSMHPIEELQAVLSVFDGEIRVTEKETPEGTKQTLRIMKLINQKCSDKEIVLTKEALSS